MQFIFRKTESGENKRKISMYCKVLGVSRQGFYNYLKNKDKPWKHQWVADLICEILEEDACNDTYGRYRMCEALRIRHPDKPIPGERTIYRIMAEMGMVHKPRRKPNGITKADKEARKSDDLIKRDFRADKPLEKCVTDITEIKCSDDKLYVSAIFDCFDATVLGLAMDTNMKAPLCIQTLKNACNVYPGLRGGRLYIRTGDPSIPAPNTGMRSSSTGSIKA